MTIEVAFFQHFHDLKFVLNSFPIRKSLGTRWSNTSWRITVNELLVILQTARLSFKIFVL